MADKMYTESIRNNKLRAAVWSHSVIARPHGWLFQVPVLCAPQRRKGLYILICVIINRSITQKQGQLAFLKKCQSFQCSED